MGLTIHWDLKAKSMDQAAAALEKVRQVCLGLPFKEVGAVVRLDQAKCEVAEGLFADRRKSDMTTEERERNKERFEHEIGIDTWTWIQTGKYVDKKVDGRMVSTSVSPLELVCLHLWAGDGCEGTNLVLAKYPGSKTLSGRASTKTQYAEEFVKSHLLVVTALDACKAAGILKSVSDEGDYWKTRDLQALGASLHEYDALVGTVGGMLTKAFGAENVRGPDGKPVLMSEV